MECVNAKRIEVSMVLTFFKVHFYYLFFNFDPTIFNRSAPKYIFELPFCDDDCSVISV